MSTKFVIDKKSSKKEFAYNKIKSLIIKNKIGPNTMLVERQLSEQFGISRTPVREALTRLASEGMVEVIPGKGFFASNISFEKFINICELREALEGMAAKLCTLKKDEQTIKRLEKSINILEGALRSENYDISVEYDLEFHNIIIGGANNSSLETLLQGIYDQIKRFAFTTITDSQRQKRSLNQHIKVLNAIINNDADLAEKLMRKHILDVKEYHVNKNYLY